MQPIYYHRRKKTKKTFWLWLVLLLFILLPGGSVYYLSGGPGSCARCHEIKPAYDSWTTSPHHEVGCKVCHGSVLTFNLRFHTQNLQRLVSHVKGLIPERIHVPYQDIETLNERCQACHRLEYAEWLAGPHGITYPAVFLDETHNHKQLLMDDCLRCHGMFFEGGIRNLVTPVDTVGPWILTDSRLIDRPAINCLVCHQIHCGQIRPEPSEAPEEGTIEHESYRPSLAFYDRRSRMHYSVNKLPVPDMMEGDRKVGVSHDVRQRLCYQCHAPLAGFEAGSGDDRTCVGVHEGIGCFACHRPHSQKTGPSCAGCHPRLSNCGLDVAEMDTTYKSPSSPHNIHSVKCADCHATGIPNQHTDI